MISWLWPIGMFPVPRHTRRRTSRVTRSSRHIADTSRRVPHRIRRKICALRGCQLRTLSSALRIPQMARKTVQTKFVSGTIASDDLAPLRRAHCCLRPAAAQIRFVSRYHGFKIISRHSPKIIFSIWCDRSQNPRQINQTAEINFSDFSSHGALQSGIYRHRLRNYSPIFEGTFDRRNF